jgi:hypothetical protein
MWMIVLSQVGMRECQQTSRDEEPSIQNETNTMSPGQKADHHYPGRVPSESRLREEWVRTLTVIQATSLINKEG